MHCECHGRDRRGLAAVRVDISLNALTQLRGVWIDDMDKFGLDSVSGFRLISEFATSLYSAPVFRDCVSSALSI